MRSVFLLFSLLSLGMPFTFGQDTEDLAPSPLKIGFGLMGISYTGDLTDQERSFRRFYPGGNLSIQFENEKNLKLQLGAGYGRFSEQVDQLTISPPEGIEPNRFVETSFFFTGVNLQWHFFPEKKFHPYLSTGANLLFFSPRDQEGNFLGENIFTRLEDEFYSTTIGSFPLTVGAQARINEVISLSLDYTYRITPTDYLDNIGALGSKPGNDALQHVQLSVYFTLLTKEELDLPPPPPDWESPPPPIMAFQLEEPAPLVVVPNQIDSLDSPAKTSYTRLKRMIQIDLARIHEIDTQAIENAPVVQIPKASAPTEPKPEIEPEPDPTPVAEKPADSVATELAITEPIVQNHQPKVLTSPRYVQYFVKKTDRLTDIADRFNTTEERIQDINRLEGKDIKEGQILTVPDLSGGKTDPFADASDPSQTQYGEEEINWIEIEEAALSKQQYVFIFVSKHDRLSEISERYHVRIETIRKINYLYNDDITADTYLRLPDMSR